MKFQRQNNMGTYYFEERQVDDILKKGLILCYAFLIETLILEQKSLTRNVKVLLVLMVDLLAKISDTKCQTIIGPSAWPFWSLFDVLNCFRQKVLSLTN